MPFLTYLPHVDTHITCSQIQNICVLDFTPTRPFSPPATWRAGGRRSAAGIFYLAYSLFVAPLPPTTRLGVPVGSRRAVAEGGADLPARLTRHHPTTRAEVLDSRGVSAPPPSYPGGI